ncbi:MAG: hypothetical protein WCI72_00250 [archaeon]
MEYKSQPLIESERFLLMNYSDILSRYTDPAIRQYSPIGWRKIPKVKRLEAKRVYDERYAIENTLGIRRRYSGGIWTLDLTPTQKRHDDISLNLAVRDLFPLLSNRKETLDYLTGQALPKNFPDFSFHVLCNYISCNGDCSWDCR